MRIFAPAPLGSSRNRSLLSITVFLAAILAAYCSAEVILGSDVERLALALAALGLAAAALAVAVLNDWRRGVYLFFGWLFFEDLFRKFLGNNMAIYFAKDGLLAVVYLSFFRAWRRGKVTSFRPPFLVPLLIFVWFCVMQVFNPVSPHVAYGVLGVKLFFYYAPLVVLGYAFVDSEIELQRFFKLNLILLLAIAVLGLAQSIVGPGFLNPPRLPEEIRGLSTLYRVAPITGEMVYRPNSVFVSTGRFANFLMLSWLVVLGFGGYLLLRQKQGRPLVFVVTAAVAAAIVMCASRGALMWSLGSSLVAVAAFIWGAPWRHGEVRRVVRALQRAAVAIGLSVVFLLTAYPAALEGRIAVYMETLSPNSSASELAWRTRDYPINAFMLAFDSPHWLYGTGIGTTGLGGQYVSRFFHVKAIRGVESGYGTLVFELGICGLLLWLAMSASLVISAWRVVKKLRGSPWFPLGFMIFWYAFLLLFPITFVSMVAYEDFVLNAYLWVLIGILFRLPTLPLSAQNASSAMLPDQSRRGNP